MTSFLVLFIWGLSQRSCSGDCANISWLGRRSGKPWRYLFLLKLSSVQSLSRVRLFATPWVAARQASLSITNSWSLLKLMSIELVMPSTISSSVVPFSSHPQCLPASGSFPSESTLHIRWPKYWSFSFSISPSNEHPGLISFRMDWLDLLADLSNFPLLPFPLTLLPYSGPTKHPVPFV